MFAAVWCFLRGLSACSGIYLSFLLFLLHSAPFILLFLSRIGKEKGLFLPLCKDLQLIPPLLLSSNQTSDTKSGILPDYVMNSLAQSAIFGETHVARWNIFLYFNICFDRTSSLASVTLHSISSVVNTDFHLTFKASVTKLFILPFLSECYQYPCSCSFPSGKVTVSNTVWQYPTFSNSVSAARQTTGRMSITILPIIIVVITWKFTISVSLNLLYNW